MSLVKSIVRPYIKIHIGSNMIKHGFDDERSSEHSCNILLMVPACIGSYVDNAKNSGVRASRTRSSARFTKNKRCTSQHTHINIVILVHRLRDKTRIFLLFIHSREWLKHIHAYVLWDRERGLGMSIIKLCLPISSDWRHFHLRAKIWLMDFEGHRTADKNEDSCA